MYARRLTLGGLAALLCTSALLTACASTNETASDSSSASFTSETAGDSTVVRLLAHDSFAISDALVADFENSTGYDLEIMSGGDAGAMTSAAVLAAGAPAADVLFGVDSTLLSRATGAGVFAPYSSANASTLRPELQQDTAGGLVTPIDFGDVCVNIDDTYFAESGVAPPTTLDDLIDPAYKDMLVVEDPAVSSPGLAFLLSTIARYGDGWRDYWQALRDNGVSVAGSWTDAYVGQFSGGGDGTRPLVVSYATSPPAEIVYAEEPKPTQPSTSVMQDGCYRQVEYAGVLEGAANPVGAQAVIDWLTSRPVQADVPLSMFVYPAVDGVALPRVFEEFASEVPDAQQLDSPDIAANLADWLAQWGDVMGR